MSPQGGGWVAHGTHRKARSPAAELEAARQSMLHCLGHGGKEERCYGALQEGCTGKSSLGIGSTFEMTVSVQLADSQMRKNPDF